eukprot:gene23826-30099_t
MINSAKLWQFARAPFNMSVLAMIGRKRAKKATVAAHSQQTANDSESETAPVVASVPVVAAVAALVPAAADAVPAPPTDIHTATPAASPSPVSADDTTSTPPSTPSVATSSVATSSVATPSVVVSSEPAASAAATTPVTAAPAPTTTKSKKGAKKATVAARPQQTADDSESETAPVVASVPVVAAVVALVPAAADVVVPAPPTDSHTATPAASPSPVPAADTTSIPSVATPSVATPSVTTSSVATPSVVVSSEPAASAAATTPVTAHTTTKSKKGTKKATVAAVIDLTSEASSIKRDARGRNKASNYFDLLGDTSDSEDVVVVDPPIRTPERADERPKVVRRVADNLDSTWTTVTNSNRRRTTRDVSPPSTQLSQHSVASTVVRGVNRMSVQTNGDPLVRAPHVLTADVFLVYMGLMRATTVTNGDCMFDSVLITLLELNHELSAPLTPSSTAAEFRAYVLQWMNDNEMILSAFTETAFTAERFDDIDTQILPL